MTQKQEIHFRKMHGLGNDFVIIDCRDNGLDITPAQMQAMGSRKRGIGCDQFGLLKRSENWQETTFMEIYNNTGEQVEACGNMTRCVADILMTEDDTDNVIIETLYGSLNCWREENGLIRVEMGKAQTEWQQIPLSQNCDTLELPIELEGLGKPTAVNVGNPHCVFFVGKGLDKWEDNHVEKLGSFIETHELFPNKTNVEFVEVLSPTHIRMRVWERGVGITEACGSGACAVAVAAIRRGLTERNVTVTLDGGDLVIGWPSDDAPISMTGSATHVFDGEFLLT